MCAHPPASNSPSLPGLPRRGRAHVLRRLGLALLCFVPDMAAAQEPEDAEPEVTSPPPVVPAPDAGTEWSVRFGARLVAGAPDGVGGSLLIQPRPWLRVHAGGARNTLGSGLRGGVDLLPIQLLVSPVLGLEYAHSFDSDYEKLLSRLHGQPTPPLTGIRQVDNDQVSATVGLEFSPWRPLTLFLGAGISYWFISVSDVKTFVREAEETPETLSAAPLRINISSPVVKLGFIFYFN